jgi:hypothetical protein
LIITLNKTKQLNNNLIAGNSYIFPLISLKDIFWINRLTLILDNICQYDVTWISRLTLILDNICQCDIFWISRLTLILDNICQCDVTWISRLTLILDNICQCDVTLLPIRTLMSVLKVLTDITSVTDRLSIRLSTIPGYCLSQLSKLLLFFILRERKKQLDNSSIDMTRPNWL